MVRFDCSQDESTEKQHNLDSLSSDSDYEETTATGR